MKHELPKQAISNSNQSKPGRPFSSPEGRIFFVGLVLLSLLFVFFAVSFFISPQKFHVFVGMTATNILFGRAAGMSFGYVLGYGHGIVFPINLAIEVIMVLLVYPLFVLSWRRLLVYKTLDNFMQRMRNVAERNQDKIRRYGIPSLFLFVLIPFWMTGPVVGCVIGFFLGIRPWLNLSVVLIATSLACIGWAVFLRNLHETVANISPFAPLVLILIIIALAIIGYILESRRRHNN